MRTFVLMVATGITTISAATAGVIFRVRITETIFAMPTVCYSLGRGKVWWCLFRRVILLIQRVRLLFMMQHLITSKLLAFRNWMMNLLNVHAIDDYHVIIFFR